MNALAILLGMAENNAWANLRLHRACGQLSRAEFAAERTGFFPSLHRTLCHILIVDWFYVDALEGGSLGLKAFESEVPFEEPDAVWAAQRAVDARLVEVCARLTDEVQLDAPVALIRRDREQIERAGDVLLHLFEHQIHHRGQAHAMLSGTWVAPPQLDEFFLADEAPLRAAELRELGLRER